MWKKEDAPRPEGAPREAMSGGPERVSPPRPSGERATIGSSITVNGEVSGNEDLLIQGRVDGSVDLKQHSVTVGPEGEVKADINARLIAVEGKVEGNLRAQEQVILRSSAVVQGDISAPRVTLEDGARFRGGVDMGESAGSANRSAGAGQARTPEAGRPTPAGSNAESASGPKTDSPSSGATQVSR